MGASAENEVRKGLCRLEEGNFRGAIKYSASALELCTTEEQLYEASVLAGRAAFCTGDYTSAEEAFVRASELDPLKLPAWEGLAETEVVDGNLPKAIETYKKLLRLARGYGQSAGQNQANVREYLWRIADTYERMACFPHAEAQLRELLEMEITQAQRLEALCFLADIQMKVEDGLLQREIHARMQAQQVVEEPAQESRKKLLRSMSAVHRMVDAQRSDEMDAEGGLADTLQKIVDTTMPCPRFVKYHEQHLQRHLSLLGNYPPRSAARQEKRINALRCCKRMIETVGGCCTPFPFEAAIWLWEETEELYGGVLAGLPISLGGDVINHIPQSQLNGHENADGKLTEPSSPSGRSSKSPHMSPRFGPSSPVIARAGATTPRRMPGRRVSLGSMPAPSSVASLEPNKTDLSVRRTTSVSAFDFDDLSALRCGSYGAGNSFSALSAGESISMGGERYVSPFAASAIPPAIRVRHPESKSNSCIASPRSERNRSCDIRREEDSILNVVTNTNVNNDLVTSKVEECGMKLAHQFPWAASAYVAVGLALRRRELNHPDVPSSALKRTQITKSLKTGVERGADSAAGWLALAGLQYQNRQYQASYETGVAGLAWSVRRRQRGHETLTQFALSMRLIIAKDLRRLGRLDEAEYAFKVLAGWVTEGESAFGEMSGSAPKSVHQQALRGIARVLLERGETAKAKWQYEKILGKALMGRGPAEHWAHSEYAWISFTEGDLQTAKCHLESALTVATQEGCAVTDWELAEHHFKLGRVLWEMGGDSRSNPEKARAQFELATREEGHAQSAAFAWLGNWEREVAENQAAARELYNIALDLDHTEPAAVDGLKMLGAVVDMERVDSLVAWASDNNPQPWSGF